MKNKLLISFLVFFYIVSYGQSRRLYVDMVLEKGDAHNELVLVNGIRSIYGDSILSSHLEKKDKGFVVLTFKDDCTISFVELKAPQGMCSFLKDNEKKWEHLVNYLKRQTFYFHAPMHSFNSKTETIYISLSLSGSLFDFFCYKRQHPDKNWINFFDYYGDYFKTYEFDLVEFGKNDVLK